VYNIYTCHLKGLRWWMSQERKSLLEHIEPWISIKKLNKESVVNGRIIDILTCTVCTIAMSMRFPLFKCIHLYKRIHSWKHSLSKSTSLPAVSQVINCLKLKIQRIEFVLRKMWSFWESMKPSIAGKDLGQTQGRQVRFLSAAAWSHRKKSFNRTFRMQCHNTTYLLRDRVGSLEEVFIT
jgi:hypothetical protein